MSMDNGTYILQTHGPEFRICQMQAIDNIFEEFLPTSETWTPHILTIVECFATSKVYRDLGEVWDAAGILDESAGGTEFGANLITDFRNYKFSEFEEQYEKVKNKIPG